MSIDLDMYEREERSKANKAAHAAKVASEDARKSRVQGDYSLDPGILARARSKVDSTSKRAIRREARAVALAVHLAVCDPESGATVRDLQASAVELGKHAGLARESVQVVEHRVSFRGMAGGARPTRDVIEAKVVEAAGLPPIAGQTGAAVPGSAAPAATPDGAAAAPPVGGGGGG